MTTVAEGRATGKTSKTYYQTGSRATPGTWNEIALVSGPENFDTGKENTISGETRLARRKIHASGAQDGAVLKLTYQRQRGIADTVWDDLQDSYTGEAAGPYEFAVMDADIAETGAVGWKFFGEVVNMEWKRDLDKYAEYEITIEERAVFESGAIQGLISYAVT